MYHVYSEDGIFNIGFTCSQAAIRVCRIDYVYIIRTFQITVHDFCFAYGVKHGTIDSTILFMFYAYKRTRLIVRTLDPTQQQVS